MMMEVLGVTKLVIFSDIVNVRPLYIHVKILLLSVLGFLGIQFFSESYF